MREKDRMVVTKYRSPFLILLLSTAFTTTSMNEHKQARSVPGFVNLPLLRAQQQQLAALRATQQLLGQQRLLRRVLKLPCVDTTASLEALNDGDDDLTADQLLVQKLMHKATQPSPLKAVFTKEELEVSICKTFYRFLRKRGKECSTWRRISIKY